MSRKRKANKRKRKLDTVIVSKVSRTENVESASMLAKAGIFFSIILAKAVKFIPIIITSVGLLFGGGIYTYHHTNRPRLTFQAESWGNRPLSQNFSVKNIGGWETIIVEAVIVNADILLENSIYENVSFTRRIAPLTDLQLNAKQAADFALNDCFNLVESDNKPLGDAIPSNAKIKIAVTHNFQVLPFEWFKGWRMSEKYELKYNLEKNNKKLNRWRLIGPIFDSELDANYRK